MVRTCPTWGSGRTLFHLKDGRMVTGQGTPVLEALDRVVGIKGMTGKARVPVVVMVVRDSKMEGVAISLVLWEEVVMGVDAW
jgi:hypothetical protein